MIALSFLVMLMTAGWNELHYRLSFDGGSIIQNNQRYGGGGAILHLSENKSLPMCTNDITVWRGSFYFGDVSSHAAELMSLVEGLYAVRTIFCNKIHEEPVSLHLEGYNGLILQIQGDSELAINSLNKHYPPKDVALRRHWSLALALMRSLSNLSPSHNHNITSNDSSSSSSSNNDSTLLSINLTHHDDVVRANEGTTPPPTTLPSSSFQSVNLTHVSREHNVAADALATLAMTTQRSFSQYYHTQGHGNTRVTKPPPTHPSPPPESSASCPDLPTWSDPSTVPDLSTVCDPNPSSGTGPDSLGMQGLLYLSIATGTIPLYLHDSFAMLALDMCIPVQPIGSHHFYSISKPNLAQICAVLYLCMQGEFESILPISLDVINSGGSGGRSSSLVGGYGSIHVNSERSVCRYIDTIGGRLYDRVGKRVEDYDGRDDTDSDNNDSDSNKDGRTSGKMGPKNKNNYNNKNRRMFSKKRHRTSTTNSKSRSSFSSFSLSPHNSPLHPVVLVLDVLKPLSFPCHLLLTLKDRTSTRKDWWRKCVVTINDNDNNNSDNDNNNNNRTRQPTSINPISIISGTSPISVLLSKSTTIDLSFPLDLPLRSEDVYDPTVINYSSELYGPTNAQVAADAVLRVKLGFVPLSSQSPSSLSLSSSSSSSTTTTNADEGTNTVISEQGNQYYIDDNNSNGYDDNDNDDGSNMIIANILAHEVLLAKGRRNLLP